MFKILIGLTAAVASGYILGTVLAQFAFPVFIVVIAMFALSIISYAIGYYGALTFEALAEATKMIWRQKDD